MKFETAPVAKPEQGTEKERRLTEEKLTLGKAIKSRVGQFLAAALMTMGAVEAAAPARARADAFDDLYAEYKIGTRFEYIPETGSADSDEDIRRGIGSATLFLRERERTDPEWIRRHPDIPLVLGTGRRELIAPPPENPITEYVETRDAVRHPEDYTGPEPVIRGEGRIRTSERRITPSDLEEWWNDLETGMVYYDEDQTRYTVIETPSRDAVEAVERARPIFPAGARERSLHAIAGTERYQHLIEAPPLINTAELEEHWLTSLEPGRTYIGDDGHHYIVMVQGPEDFPAAYSANRADLIAHASDMFGAPAHQIMSRREERTDVGIMGFAIIHTRLLTDRPEE